ncbi:MAG: RNA polymerase sigma factor [Elusimicrobia bacterium]|nr:RNA polymerase sigma factor [Elusimicrobiota bacterium]
MSDEKEPDDSEAVRRVLEGDLDAYRWIVRRYQDLFYDLALRMTGIPADAEDLAQAALLRAYRSLATYDRSRSFRNWAYSVALNTIRNHLRRGQVLRLLSLEWLSTEVASPEPLPSGETLLARIEAALPSLPVSLREAFVLHHFHEKSAPEVAEALGISRSAAHVRLFRARRALAARLGIEPSRSGEDAPV